MKVNDVARLAGVTAHAVRYYDRIGLLSAARDPANRYRRFGLAAVERLRFVRQAKRLGFSLKEIRAVLEMCEAGQSPCPTVRAIVHARIAENRLRIAELEHLQARLERAYRQWEALPDGEVSGEVVCRLIESLGAEDEPAPEAAGSLGTRRPAEFQTGSRAPAHALAPATAVFSPRPA